MTHQLAEAAIQIETRKNEQIHLRFQLFVLVRTHVSGNPVAFFLRAYRRGQCRSRSHHWSERCSRSNWDGKAQMDGVRYWPDSRRAD